MRRQCFNTIIIFFLSSGPALAQTEEPYVINAGAGEMETEDLNVSYYVGDYIGYDHPDVDESLTGMEEIWVYPNPVKTKLNVRTSIPDLDKVQIYQVDGILLVEAPISGNEIDLSGFPDGVYLLKILNAENEEVGSAKVIKTK